jgi:dolichyl-phosphate beta-glucosyltransferase
MPRVVSGRRSKRNPIPIYGDDDVTAPGNRNGFTNAVFEVVNRYRTFVKYCLVGSTVTGVDFIVFSLGFYALGLASVPSKLCAFGVAGTLSYILNRTWTFRSKDQRVSLQFSRFAAVAIVGALLSAATIFFLIDLLSIHPLIANGITSALVLSWNFLANKYWTFRVSRKACPVVLEPKCHLSLVVPAYNEEHRIGKTLAEDVGYLSRQSYSWEVIIVDDGSRDGTVALAAGFCEQHPSRVRIVRLPRNRGKGAAVQIGVVNAVGRFVIIADADNATPIQEVERFLAEAKEGEIIIGSRYLGSSQIDRKQSRLRILIGRAGNLLIKLFLIDGIADTQCGFKLFPLQIAHDLFSRQRISGWGFDMEVLSLAQKSGISIREKGVTWRDVPGSRLRPIRAAIRTFVELVIIKINLWSGVYE